MSDQAAAIQELINVICSYFEHISGEAADMGVPYIFSGGPGHKSYTGAIAFSGSHRGLLLFSTESALLQELGGFILGDDAESLGDGEFEDLAGEVSNTLAGNMRKFLGSRYFISVPVILYQDIGQISGRLERPLFMIPLAWKGHQALVAISIE